MINKVILLGRVGKDPETRNGTSGNIATFSLATSEKYKNKQGESVENTEWHSITAFKNLADIVDKYVKKGDLLYIEGKIHTNTWDDKEGNKRYSTGIIADVIKMIGGKKDNDRQEPEPKSNPIVNKDNGESDDLPF